MGRNGWHRLEQLTLSAWCILSVASLKLHSQRVFFAARPGKVWSGQARYGQVGLGEAWCGEAGRGKGTNGPFHFFFQEAGKLWQGIEHRLSW